MQLPRWMGGWSTFPNLWTPWFPSILVTMNLLQAIRSSFDRVSRLSILSGGHFSPQFCSHPLSPGKQSITVDVALSDLIKEQHYHQKKKKTAGLSTLNGKLETLVGRLIEYRGSLIQWNRAWLISGEKNKTKTKQSYCCLPVQLGRRWR